MTIDNADQETGQGGAAEQPKPMDTLRVEARPSGGLAEYLKIAFAGGEKSTRHLAEMRVGIEQLPTFKKIVALGAFHLLENLLELQAQALKEGTHFSASEYTMLFSPLEAKAHSLGFSELFSSLRKLIPADLNLISDADARRLLGFLGLNQKFATTEFGGINLAETRFIVLSALTFLLLLFLAACGPSELQAEANPTAVPAVELIDVGNPAYPVVTEEPTQEPTEAPPANPEAQIYELTRYTIAIKTLADGTVHSIEIHSKEDANYAIIFFDSQTGTYSATVPTESSGTTSRQLTWNKDDQYVTLSFADTGELVFQVARTGPNAATPDGASLNSVGLFFLEEVDRTRVLAFLGSSPSVMSITIGTPTQKTATVEAQGTPSPTATTREAAETQTPPSVPNEESPPKPETSEFSDYYGFGNGTETTIRTESLNEAEVNELVMALDELEFISESVHFDAGDVDSTRIQLQNLLLTGFQVSTIEFENAPTVAGVTFDGPITKVVFTFGYKLNGTVHKITVTNLGGSPNMTRFQTPLTSLDNFPSFTTAAGSLKTDAYTVGDNIKSVVINIAEPGEDVSDKFVIGHVKLFEAGKSFVSTVDQLKLLVTRFFVTKVKQGTNLDADQLNSPETELDADQATISVIE